jgi:hypothetical protein
MQRRWTRSGQRTIAHPIGWLPRAHTEGTCVSWMNHQNIDETSLPKVTLDLEWPLQPRRTNDPTDR